MEEEEEKELDLLPLTQCAELFWCVTTSLSGSAWMICFCFSFIDICLWIFFSNMVIEFGLELEKKVETYLADFRGVNRKGIQADAAKALYNFHFHGITIYVFSQQTPTYSPTLRQPPFLQDVPILISSPSSSRETERETKK